MVSVDQVGKDLRCAGFLAEIDKRDGLGKFTSAELEESEGDFEKLAALLAKLGVRIRFG